MSPARGWVISNQSVGMPGLVYGTAWKKEQTAALVEQALRCGFRGIDTACQPKHYNEAGVGAGLAVLFAEGLRREDIYLQSKFTPLGGQDPGNIPYDPKATLAAQVKQSFAVSLRNLGTSYLDCLVLHSPLQPLAALLEVWTALESLFDTGAVKQLGISNCYELKVLESLHRNARIKPAVVQNRYYAQTGFDREMRAFCRQQNIFYQSFWTLSANPVFLAHPTLRDLAARHGVHTEQILFRYLTQRDVIPLTGTKSRTHMSDDLAIFDFELAHDECARVAAVEDALRA